ncbi:MAG: divalent-cation tolerance protein CutA [Thermoplasmata archaeon]|nr:divalent-cation tolerance protein CutA [Thermoplasmata archaeon]
MYCVIITTCKPEDEEKIIDALLSSKLVACINSFSVKSKYIWKGKIEEDEEKLLIIKTKKEKHKEVEKKIKENHSYEVPEIICLDIVNGSDSYLRWIDEVVE